MLKTLNSVLKQSYRFIEVVVSNNSRQEGVLEMVKSFNDERIKYICPDKKMSFSGDWNFALSGATGEYVTFLGDDDSALPVGYAIGMDFLVSHPNSAFTWKKLNYNWPDHVVPSQRNLIVGEHCNEYVQMNARKALGLFSYFMLGYSQLPCIYNSIVPHSAIKSVIAKTESKQFFAGVIPDVFSSFALANELDNYFYAYFSLTLNGASNKSSGVLQGLSELSSEQKELIPDAMNSGSMYHPDIGPFSSSIASIALGEYLLAKDRIRGFKGRSPSWFLYVLYLIRESKYTEKPSEIISAARFTSRRRKLPFWFSKTIKRKKVKFSSVFMGNFYLNPNIISDADQASAFFSELNSNNFQDRKMNISKFMIKTLSAIKTNAVDCIRYCMTR